MVLLAGVPLCVAAEVRDVPSSSHPSPPSLEEVLAARRDLWGEAAVGQPDGPSFEFFASLLPPPRYTNAAFRHYPFMLSVPRGLHKTRVVSNGSGINLRADQPPMWKENAVPVHFAVGKPGEPFGGDVQRLTGPGYEAGHLPIVQMSYAAGTGIYEQEVFAGTDAADAERGAVYVRFRPLKGSQGRVAARVESPDALSFENGCLRDPKGRVILVADAGWKWQAQDRQCTASLEGDRMATMVVYTALPDQPAVPRLDPGLYDRARRQCVQTWSELLDRGAKLEVPEPLVNRMWKSHIVGNFMIARKDWMNYSAGNAYDHLYEGECGDAARALMLYGFLNDGRDMVGPLLDFFRKATQYHVSGLKLQLLAHYYWLARDADYVGANRERWMKAVETILSNREKENGLVPRENYCGDISQQVYALNSNAQGWRGLRDLSAVLEEIGEREQARSLAETAAAYRRDILQAVEKSERRDVQPPFIPNALFGEEQPYPMLTDTRIGGYYDLMAPYIIGSEVLGPGSQRETWMIRYLQEHGGLCMGMVRTRPDRGQYAGQPGVVFLYSLRYALAQMRRDEREAALVTFYGGLAQAMTRETFIGGEATRFPSMDPLMRTIYLPPNSTNNSTSLWLLRYMLIQDWDLNDDGRPETLRLLYGAPRRWLRDGASIRFENAPTQFGGVSLQVRSHLNDGHVELDVKLPPRAPDKVLARISLPDGWKAGSATLDGSDLPLASDGAMDLTGRSGEVRLKLAVVRSGS